MGLRQNLTTLQAGVAAAGRIRQVGAVDVEPDTVAAAPGPVGEPPSGHAVHAVIELRGVRAAYGPDLEPAVRDVDLAIPRRGHTAIVGPSGAGRSRHPAPGRHRIADRATAEEPTTSAV